MLKPEVPANEAERLDELHSLGLLDSVPEERFDRITRLAQRLFSVPTALITLVDEDRQWFMSRVGLEPTETPRDVSFCGHAILGDEIMMVTDATKDERFCDNPLVRDSPEIRFYAGCPIVGPGGSKLGTLCLIGRDPRELSQEELELLRDLADMVEHEIATNKMAVTDPLTGLGNRRGFEMAASVVFEINRRRGVDTALLYFDLDKFKEINDRFGHAEGDRALCEFAELLHNVLRVSDVIARLGGDEFVALLSVTNDYEMVVHRIQKSLEVGNRDGHRQYSLEASIGVAVITANDDESLESIMQRADESMYEQKRGRARGTQV